MKNETEKKADIRANKFTNICNFLPFERKFFVSESYSKNT